jgi:hypothetical protein
VAIQPLTQAATILEKQGAPEDLADARFALARALWEGVRNRGRALTLARQAREGFARTGDVRREDLAKVDQWLDRHAPEERKPLA